MVLVRAMGHKQYTFEGVRVTVAVDDASTPFGTVLRRG